jgi:hypothetical protein
MWGACQCGRHCIHCIHCLRLRCPHRPQMVVGCARNSSGRLQPPTPEDCPGDVWALIQQCTSSKSAERPTAKVRGLRQCVYCSRSGPVPPASQEPPLHGLCFRAHHHSELLLDDLSCSSATNESQQDIETHQLLTDHLVPQECFARLRTACTPGPAFTPASCQHSSTEGSLLAALSSLREAAGSSDAAAAALPARPQHSRTTGSLAALVSEVGLDQQSGRLVVAAAPSACCCRAPVAALSTCWAFAGHSPSHWGSPRPDALIASRLCCRLQGGAKCW